MLCMFWDMDTPSENVFDNHKRGLVPITRGWKNNQLQLSLKKKVFCEIVLETLSILKKMSASQN